MAQTTIQGSFLGDGTVTGVKIGADFISAQTVLSSGLATTDEIIVSDAGVIKKIAMSVWAAATITLTNKSIDLGTNTLTGSVAEFNAALQSESFATLGGTETLVAKTLTTPTIVSTGWTNATHAHAADNSGATLSASILGAGTLPAARIAADSIVEEKLDISNGPQNGYYLQTNGSGVLTWAAAGGLRSSVWEMPHFVIGTATLSHGGHGFHTSAIIGDASSDGQARLSIHVPSDVTTLERAVALFISVQTGNMRIQFDTDFAATGEIYNENYDSISEFTQAVVDGELLEIDVRNALGGIAAGDQLGFRTERSGSHSSDTVTTVHFLGLIMEWS